MEEGSIVEGSTIDDTLRRIESQSNVSTANGWMGRWQKIEESMSKLRVKETSATDSVDSSSQVVDLRKDPKERTLIIKVRLEPYPISWEILDKIFSKFGMIEYLEVFCRGEEYHSTIRFQRKESAMEALESLNHRYIYDIYSRLELFLLSLIEPPSLLNQEVIREQPMIVRAPTVGDSPWNQEIAEPSRGSEEELESSEAPKPAKASPYEALQDSYEAMKDAYQKMMVSLHKTIDAISIEGNSNLEVRSPTEEFTADEPTDIIRIEKITSSSNELSQETEAILKTCETMNCDCAFLELVKRLIESMKIRVANSRNGRITEFWGNSFDCHPIAHKVFVKMHRKGVPVMFGLRVGDCFLILVSFGMRIVSLGIELNQERIKLPFDRGQYSIGMDVFIKRCFSLITDSGQTMGKFYLVFDPGGGCFGPKLLPVIAAFCNEISGLFVHRQGSRIAMTYDQGKACMDALEVQLVSGVVVPDPGGSVEVELEIFLRKVAVLRTFYGCHCAHNFLIVIKVCFCGVIAEVKLILGLNCDLKFIKNGQNSLPFDRGITGLK